VEWLAANIFNIVTSVILIGGGVGFAKSLDNRLSSIEREQIATKAVVVTSARLEERISYLAQTVLAQGKRLDRVVERIYGTRQTEDECSN